MRLRLTKIDEYQFLTCFKHGLWGSKSARFKNWQKGDLLAIIVDKNLAALAEVTSPTFQSKDKVWDNGLFPHRLRLRFLHVLHSKDRPPILGEVRDALTQQWGPRYGWAILNQQILESPNADIIAKAIKSKPDGISDYQKNLEILLEEAKVKREQAIHHKRVKGRPKKRRTVQIEQPELFEDKPVSKRDTSEHTKTQSELVTLGRITGCSVWIASNDQSRKYDGKNLADECLKKLPNLGLNAEATKRISLIDVIWINQNAPKCAFEVESSTSIYSGLLRMSDLLAVVPALNLQIFIVAPKERQAKVMGELGRPTFRKIGLSDYCRFISTEDLTDLILRVKGLGGHVQPSILDTIAVPLEEEEEDSESP
jgi:hypothetical protein